MNKGVKHAKNVQNLVMQLDKFIAAILIGNDFVNIGISAIFTAIFIHFFGYNLGVVISTFVSSFFVLTLCEITPKILAIKYTEKIALFSSPLMEKIIRVFNPLISVFTGIGNLILRLIGIKPKRRSPLITEEELRMMIEIGRQEGVLTDEERRMLYRIFEFGDTKVNEVMIPKEKMICVDINTSPEYLIDMFVKQRHSRIPVFEGNLDNIRGIIYDHDLLYVLCSNRAVVIHELLRNPYFVSPQRKVNELLREFQVKKFQIAIVREADKTLGLVTLEDLLEEIVGEIEEEQLWKRQQ